MKVLFHKIMNVEYDKKLIRNKTIKNLIRCCLKKDPSERPSIQQLCNHAIIKPLLA